MTTSKETFELTIHLREQQEGEELPDLALYHVTPQQKVAKKIAELKNTSVNVPKTLAKEGATIGLGPNIKDLSQINAEDLLRLSARKAEQLSKENIAIEVPRTRWLRWFVDITCVSGTAKKYLHQPESSHDMPEKHPPLCHGRVEIYEVTCCCDPWVLIPDIPDLVSDLIPEIDLWDPIPVPDLELPNSLLRNRRPPANPDLASQKLTLQKTFAETSRKPVLSPRIKSELITLARLRSQRDQHEFLVQRPRLVAILCRRRSCSTRRLGSTEMGMDGEFSFCHLRFRLPLQGRFCSRSYAYKVWQSMGGVDVLIYDGLAFSEYFSGTEPAEILTDHPRAEACPDRKPPVEADKPFVMLQAIGSTDTHQLHSPVQLSETGLNTPLPENGGLVDQDYSDDCPFGGTLNLLLYIDPGMQSLGAKYYRFSWVPVDGSGNPSAGSNPERLEQAVSWRRFTATDGEVEVEAESLGPVGVNGTRGLYQIPYLDQAPWLGNQFHYRLNTGDYPNGRHLLLLELFDQNGNRMRPAGSGTAQTGEIEADFSFLRWTTGETTENVPFPTLAHVLHIDNLECNGSIEGLYQGGELNGEQCQFLEGKKGSDLEIGYRAYHQNGFMMNWKIGWVRGLGLASNSNSSGTFDEGGGDNKPSSMSSGGAARTNTDHTFESLLGSKSKCTFSLNLHVECKHTAGHHSRIKAYDYKEHASFALEVSPTNG